MTETETIEKPSPSEPTDRQRAVYDWVVDYCESHGYSPSIRELMAAFGFKSPNGAMCHLHPLRKKGWVTWSNRHCRTIRPIGGVK
jgi:repressor LexA